MRRIRLFFLRRQSERLRAEWLAAGAPPDGPERLAMMASFMREGQVRYARVLRHLR